MFVAGLVIAGASFLDFCDLVYACGCRAAWLGAATACNIHEATGPHCPWCSYGFIGGAIPFGAIALTQAAIAFWPGEVRPFRRTAAVILAFPAVGSATALLFGLFSGYWTA